MTESTNAGAWICFQVGGREHYAIPRALGRMGVLDAVVTDIWSPPRSPGRLLPGRLGTLMRSRYHNELSDANVIGFNQGALTQEVAARLGGNRGWEQILERNRWFQKNAVKTLKKLMARKNPPTTVFAYSYAAKEIFKVAHAGGATTILGQIDPGPREMELVHAIEASHGVPLSQAPPPAYWESWRDEVDLADVVVANSAWSQQLLIESGASPSKIKIVPLVYEGPEQVKRNRIGGFPDGDQPLRILFLGQVIARKGIIELTEAIKILSNRPVSWTIVGGGDSELLSELGGIPRVELAGQVSRDLVGSYYNDHDVFILPTHSDGFAITQLEAMAFGLPVIASKKCGDVVRDMETGILLDNVEASNIVSSVERLLCESELLNHFRSNVATTKFFSMDKLGQQLIDCATPKITKHP